MPGIERSKRYLGGRIRDQEFSDSAVIEQHLAVAGANSPLVGFAQLDTPVSSTTLANPLPETFSFTRIANDYKAAGRTLSVVRVGQHGSPVVAHKLFGNGSWRCCTACVHGIKMRRWPFQTRGRGWSASFQHSPATTATTRSRRGILQWLVSWPSYALEHDAKWLYGAAALTNISRIGSREHWASDIIAGSVIEYELGRVF